MYQQSWDKIHQRNIGLEEDLLVGLCKPTMTGRVTGIIMTKDLWAPLQPSNNKQTWQIHWLFQLFPDPLFTTMAINRHL
uniref:Uncharacterized protein n=1 Tax=Bracon brevicornis TaxID=1563983 RepID=A0A6V7HSD9_9HYME